MKVAMLEKDPQKLEGIRAIKAGILLLKSSGKPVTEEDEIKAMQKMVKQRKESADIYIQQNRKDLADVELSQLTVIETYLPKQMSEEEIRTVVAKIISQVGASLPAGRKVLPADMGKVMGVVTKQLAGKADGKFVSGIVKEILSK